MFFPHSLLAAAGITESCASCITTEKQDITLNQVEGTTSEFLYTLLASLVAALFIRFLKQGAPRKPKRKSLTLPSQKAKASDFPLRESTASPRSKPPPSVSAWTLERRLSNSLASAVRAGRAEELPELIDAARERAITSGVGASALPDMIARLMLSCFRTCASKRRFPEALSAYDHVAAFIEGSKAFDASGWSLILYTALECREFSRCGKFIGKLFDAGKMGDLDFSNIVRYYVEMKDTSGLKAALLRLHAEGFVPESITRNRALAICVAQKAFAMAYLLADFNMCAIAMDTVGFNTLMKGWAQVGQVTRCFDVYAQMREKGLVPSSITYGILLDACVHGVDVSILQNLFSDMCKSDVKLNVIHYTSFIKSLIAAGRLDDSLAMLEEMLRSEDIKPDRVTYSVLVKAFAEKGNVQEAMNVLKRMLTAGIAADVFVFNNVLGGCYVNPMETSKVLEVFDELVRLGLRATACTVSILVKAYARTEAFRECLELLKNGPERLGVSCDQKHYLQLAQKCAREHLYPLALEVYITMVRAACREGYAITETVNSMMLRYCDSGGPESRAAAALHGEIARRGGVAPEPEALAAILRGVRSA